MARRQSNKGTATAPADKAEQAAAQAAPAAAEQLATQPAATIDNATQMPGSLPGSTEQPVSEATVLEGGETGQDAHLFGGSDKEDRGAVIVISAAQGIGAYLEALKAGNVAVTPLAVLGELWLRQVAQFVEIEGHDVLPPEQLIPLIEAKADLQPPPDPEPATSDSPVIDAAAAAVLAAGADNALDDDGDVEGLWVTAIPEQGFRRCGFRFTREGVGIALSALTETQIEQLEHEPNLKVERGIFGGRVGVQ